MPQPKSFKRNHVWTPASHRWCYDRRNVRCLRSQRDVKQWDDEAGEKMLRRSKICRLISNKILSIILRRWYLIPIKNMFSNTLAAHLSPSRILLLFHLLVRRFDYHPSISHVENKLPPRCLHMKFSFDHNFSRVCVRVRYKLDQQRIKIPRQMTACSQLAWSAVHQLI